jgi:hypothetical protein
LEKVKSRLVARGDMQDRSMYSFEEISAQVATLTSVMTTATIAAKEGRYNCLELTSMPLSKTR